MATSNPSHTVIFKQLAEVAPSVGIFLETYSARLHADIVSGDALNGYGHSVTIKVAAQVLLERCKLCGETQFTAPVLNCSGHRVEVIYHTLAEAQASSFESATTKLEPQIAAWLKERRI